MNRQINTYAALIWDNVVGMSTDYVKHFFIVIPKISLYLDIQNLIKKSSIS